MTTVFHAWLYDRSIEIQSSFRRNNVIAQIKAPIFLEVVLVIEIMYEPQSNLEEDVNPILKYDFSSRADPSIFTSVAPVLIDQSNETS